MKPIPLNAIVTAPILAIWLALGVCSSGSLAIKDGTQPRKMLGTLDVELVRSPFTANSKVVTRKVIQALNKKDWDALELLGQVAENDKDFSVMGYNQVSTFGDALEELKGTSIEKRLEQLQAWQSAKPKSSLAAAAHAELLVTYAWKARGSGWSNSVSEEGWNLMHERLNSARKALSAVSGKGIRKTRGWYKAMSHVALGQGWSHAEYDALFDEARKAYPDFSQFYYDKAYWLLPRWYGEPGEWERFANESADALGGKEGDMLYARIVWYIHTVVSDELQHSDFSMQRFESGLNAMSQAHSNSPDWVVSPLSELACVAMDRGDREIARRAFDRLDNKVSVRVFRYKEQFFSKRKLVYQDE